MKQIIAIGKPTHYRYSNMNVSACGLVGAPAAYDPRDVDCLRCMKTRIYRKAVGKK